MVYVLGTLFGVIAAAFLAVVPFLVLLRGSEFVLDLLNFGPSFRLARMVLKSLRRNRLW